MAKNFDIHELNQFAEGMDDHRRKLVGQGGVKLRDASVVLLAALNPDEPEVWTAGLTEGQALQSEPTVAAAKLLISDIRGVQHV